MYDNQGWTHPPGSNLVAWVKNYRTSAIVYVQGGDDPEAYASEHFRRLITNAVNWVMSDEAKAWAAARPGSAERLAPAAAEDLHASFKRVREGFPQGS